MLVNAADQLQQLPQVAGLDDGLKAGGPDLPVLDPGQGGLLGGEDQRVHLPPAGQPLHLGQQSGAAGGDKNGGALVSHGLENIKCFGFAFAGGCVHSDVFHKADAVAGITHVVAFAVFFCHRGPPSGPDQR